MTHRAYLFERKMPPLLHIDLTCLLSDRYKKHSKLACMGLTPTFLTFMRVMRGRLSRYIVIVPSTSSGTVGRQAQGPWGDKLRDRAASSKTLRTRRSLETVLFSEPYWVLACCARQGTKYEMLSERSEPIEWLLKSDRRPPSSGRFRTLSFASVFFLVTERKWRHHVNSLFSTKEYNKS